MNIQHIVVMGVAGCGKSTLARALANALNYPMIEGDEYHPAASIAKMSAGVPLTDDDRKPWLNQLNQLLKQANCAVLSCSALKQSYRVMLLDQLPNDVLFVHVHGAFDTLLARVQARSEHFMPASLLQSQYDALEPLGENNAYQLTVSINNSTAAQCEQVMAHLLRCSSN